MSPNTPCDFGLDSGAAEGGGGTFIATLVAPVSFDFDASFEFSLEASASFVGFTVFGASASLGAAGSGATATSVALDSIPCDWAAAKRSLNMEGEIGCAGAGFAKTDDWSGKEAKASLMAWAALRVVIRCGAARTTGSSVSMPPSVG